MAIHQPKLTITKEFLDANPEAIFVFGDNTLHRGKAGAAMLRDHPQARGFVTKRYPNNRDASFFKPGEYMTMYISELHRLEEAIMLYGADKTWYVSQLGAGLANRFGIWESVIKPGLESQLDRFDNVVMLWEK